MQDPIEEAGACIPMENVRNGPNMIGPLHRKAAKRTYPWELPTSEVNVVVSLPPPLRDEDIPATKNPLLPAPLPPLRDKDISAT
jgi:hypothetical protein